MNYYSRHRRSRSVASGLSIIRMWRWVRRYEVMDRTDKAELLVMMRATVARLERELGEAS